MTRTDYFDDPGAPAATSVVPSVVAIVQDDRGRILLIHRTDNDLWALPGGGHEIGESIAGTVVREVKEETGYDVEVLALSGIYANPRHVIAYDDGEVRQQFSIAFRCRLVGGEGRTSSESRAVSWIDPDELDALDVEGDGHFEILLDSGRRTARRVAAFDEIAPGAVALVVDSYGLISLAARQASAAFDLGIDAGHGVTLRPVGAGDGGDAVGDGADAGVAPVAIELGRRGPHAAAGDRSDGPEQSGGAE